MTYDYGLWGLVAIHVAWLVVFALAFLRPVRTREWRSLGVLTAFVVALYVEMYGFPLTIYLLSGWLANRYPTVDPMSHDAGHLWYRLLGFHGDPQYAGFVLIMFGFLLQWPTLPTLVMFPILVAMYARLARREEREVRAQFGETWDAYANNTPRYFPRLHRKGQSWTPETRSAG
jgi:protein-S-isoprenylcysteine O-methyltransferase Ste14